MRWSTVVFDLDGTLVDTIDLIVASFEHAHREVLGETIDRETVLPWIGRTLTDTWTELAPDHVEELLTTYRTWNLANLERLQRTYPGVAELLRSLARAGVRVAVATAKGREAATASLAAGGLTESVETMVTMEDTERHKPHPDPIRCALERVGVSAAETVYVGDAVTDLQAARAAGVGAIAVTWGAGDAEQLRAEAPDAVCDTADELRRVLLGQ